MAYDDLTYGWRRGLDGQHMHVVVEGQTPHPPDRWVWTLCALQARADWADEDVVAPLCLDCLAQVLPESAKNPPDVDP